MLDALPPIGSKVLLRPCFGADAPIVGVVTGHGENKGRLVIDYHPAGVPNPAYLSWAYLYQIDKVLA